MNRPKNISFDYDYDSNLYMLSKDLGAKNWKVIVHCADGKKHVPPIEKFYAYPGCSTHEGEAAWSIEFYKAINIEIKRPGMETVIFRHPDSDE